MSVNGIMEMCDGNVNITDIVIMEQAIISILLELRKAGYFDDEDIRSYVTTKARLLIESAIRENPVIHSHQSRKKVPNPELDDACNLIERNLQLINHDNSGKYCLYCDLKLALTKLGR